MYRCLPLVFSSLLVACVATPLATPDDAAPAPAPDLTSSATYTTVDFGAPDLAARPTPLAVTVHTPPTSTRLLLVGYDDKIGYVAYGADSPGHFVIDRSPDGLAWSAQHAAFAVTAGCGAGGVGGIAFVGDNVLACSGGNGGAIVSHDGAKSWGPAPLDGLWASVAVGPTGFVMVGAPAGGPMPVAATSPDGATWTPHPFGFPGFPGALVWTGTQFVLVGEQQLVGHAFVVTSPDGVTWTEQPAAEASIPQPGNAPIAALATDGHGDVLALVAGALYASADGVKWRALGPAPDASVFLGSTGSEWLDVAFPKQAASVLGASPDGVQWQTATLGPAKPFAVTGLGPRIVLVGDAIYTAEK